MKKVLVLFLLLAATLFALDKALITVKSATVNNGVVIVTIQDSGKTFELQCNQSSGSCVSPKPGSYGMVRLEKNHGMYDCDNVDLYSQSADPAAEDAQLLGEYCINQK
jgi:hypothetical protein